MRYFLTILAIIVIVFFSAALAVPYIVNWNDQRAVIAARISQFLGARVTINGPIDLKLLPMPHLMLGDIEIAAQDGKSRADVSEIRLEIALAPLLRGDVDFVEARLLRPRFHVQIEDDGTVHLPHPAEINGEIRFERISIEDGDIVIDDPATGRNHAFEGLDIEAEAPAIEGPFKGEGSIGRDAQRTALRFSTAALENDQLRFKLILDETQSHPRAELEGNLGFDPNGRALPKLDGRLTLNGHVADAVTMPWRVSGMLHGELRAATMTDLDLRLGDEDHSVSLSGAAEIDLGKEPHARVTLAAKQINLDRLLTVNNAPAPPQRLEDMLRKWIATAPAVPVPITLDWALETLLLGNESFGNISGTIGLSKTDLPVLRISAEGPGQSRLLLDGKVETGSAPAFNGRVEAAAGDLARLNDWVATNLPDLGVVKSASPIRSFDISGKLNLSQVGFFGSDLRLRIDRSALAGSLAYTRAVGNDPPRLYADLSAQGLDIDHLPDLHEVLDQTKAMDLSLRLDSRSIKIAEIGQGPVDAGRIALKLTKAGTQTTLESFDIAGLGGMNLHATGNFDGRKAQVEVKLDADRLADAAGLLRRVYPGPTTELLAARAPMLSPTHLTLSAEMTESGADRLALTNLSLNGVTAQTNVKAKLAPDPHNASHVTLAAHVDAPELSALFRQIGFSALPIKGLGGGQIDLTAHGEAAKPLDAQISATLAGTKLDFNGLINADVTQPDAKGTLKLASRDLSGLMETTALAFPDLTGRLPADLTTAIEWRRDKVSLHKLEGSFAGKPIKADLTYANAPARHLSGSLELANVSLADFVELTLGPAQMVKAGQVWSEDAFTGGLMDPPTTSISINAKNFTLWPGVVGASAKLDLDLAADRAGPKLTLHLNYMRLGSGGIEGDLALRRDGAAASTEGHISVQDFRLDLPSLAGTLNADLDFASTGRNAAALITGLAGTGNVSLTDLNLPHSDPRALMRVFKAVEADQIGIDEAEIARALTREFDKKPLRLNGAEFDAGLAAGILRLTPKADAPLDSPAPEDKITLGLQASIDWHNLTLDQRASLRLGKLPKNWKDPPPQVGLVINGPLAHPTRTIEAATFTNSLAARAIARESARIELQEFDLHERAVNYQRLRSERRREIERQKAEEDAKRAAEEAKRAAEEAKRAAELAAQMTDRSDNARKIEIPPPAPNYELRRSPMPPLRPLPPPLPLHSAPE